MTAAECRRASDRWLLHYDEASTIQMRDNPLGDDRRHDIRRLSFRQVAIVCQCERQGREEMLPINTEELFGRVALVVGHLPA